MEQAAVVESQPTMDISVGPVVGMNPEQRTEWRKTGELPTEAPKDQPKTEEPASSSEPAGDSESPKQQEKTKAKPKQTAEERIVQLEATIAKIKSGAGLDKPKAESVPAKTEPEPTRPKPTVEDKKEDGTPKYSTYEEFVEDLADWKTEQREAKAQRERAVREQTEKFNAKLNEARNRYENFDTVRESFVEAISDPKIDRVIHAMLNDSEVLPDLAYTIASDPETLENFAKMAKNDPGRALRYIALTESLIVDALENKPADPPAKPKTEAPKPPSEVGGRTAAPPDALIAAAQANDFRSFKAEATRRQLAKMRG